jgi:hypothetical protein
MTNLKATTATEFRLSRRWQWLLLVPVTVHLLAVFSEPFHFFSRSEVQTAPDAMLLRSWLHPYSQWMYLDHGYFFFAPNPGPGHLLRISASDDPLPPAAEHRSQEDAATSDAIVNLLPDRKSQFPRLLYHRYFMLSEFYYNRYAPYELTPELSRDPVLLQNWKSDRKLYTSIQQSIISHTKYKTGKTFVRLDRLERTLPDRASILKQGIRLTDPQWISVLPETMSESPSISSQTSATNVRNGGEEQPLGGVTPETVPARALPEKDRGR